MMRFSVPDMTCGHCVATVTKAIKSLDAEAQVQVELGSKTVTVETSVAAPAVARALENAGYAAQLI
jgi:copper chaperone